MKNAPSLRLSLLTTSLLLPLASDAAQLKGLWEFQDPADLGKTTLGSPLVFTGAVTATTGPNGDAGAADFPKDAWAAITNPIAANGASGTPTRTNQYTIVLDFKVPSFAGTYTSLFDFDNGGSDGDYFIRKSGNELGSTPWPYVGASGTVQANTWYRLVIAADVGVGRSVYLNGSLVGNYSVGTLNDARSTLSTTTALRLLWDNAGETSRTIVSNLALYEGRLTAEEVTALGTAGTTIPLPGATVPAMVAQDAGTSPVAPGFAANYSFSATDAGGDQVQFEINWGDGQTDAWSPLQAVASPYAPTHTYAFPGSYTIQARVRDSQGNVSAPTTIQTISVEGKALTWTGALGSVWSTGTLAAPKNWVLTSDATTTSDFATGDDVVFGSSPVSSAVAINGSDVTPLTVSVDSDSNYTISGDHGMTGPATLAKSGTGTLTLENPNPLQGNTTIIGGSVRLNHSLGLSNSIIETTFPDGSLSFGTVTSATVGGLAGSGDIQLKNQSNTAVALTLGKDTATSEHFGEISGGGSLVKVGSGTQALEFSNLYTGGTTLNAGILRIGNADALGTGAAVHAGGSLMFAFGAGTVANDIVLAPTAYQTFIVRGSGNSAPAPGTEVTLTGKISGGTAGLTYRLVDSNTGLNHNNVLILANPANDFNGTVELWRGFLAFTSDAALGNPDNDLRIDCNNGNGGLRFDADGITLNPNRTITLVTSNNQEGFTVPSGTGTIAGPIVGAGAMIKRGDGELILSSAANTFTGNVSVAGGKFTVNGAIATSANPITVTATGTLGGSGTINRTVNSPGTIAPGSGTGTLTATAATITGTLAVEIDGSSADKLAVTGNLDITGATLDVSLLGGGFTQPSYVIATYGGTLTGTFATITPGYSVTYSGGQISIQQQTGSGFDAWAASKGVTGFDTDSDGDGIQNGIEFVIGGEPAEGAGSNSIARLPQASYNTATQELVFVFRRTAESAYLNPSVEYSTSLLGAWNPAPSGTVIGNAAGADLVEVRLPSSLASTGKIFARLKVAQ